MSASAGGDHVDRGQRHRHRGGRARRRAGRSCSCIPASASIPPRPCSTRSPRRARVIAPIASGLRRARNCRRASSTVDDLAYFYLDLLDAARSRATCSWSASSLGGWIAAEIAVKIDRAAVAARAGQCGRHQGRRPRDPRHRRHLSLMPDRSSTRSPISIPTPASATTRACRRQTCWPPRATARPRARYAWSPYMHNPKLKSRLHRIRIPTLLLWGTADRILSESIRPRAIARRSRARASRPIERAGHFPHLEQPEEFARRVLAFAGTARTAARARDLRRLAMQVYQFTEQPYTRRLERPQRLAARQPAEPQDAIPKIAADLFHRYYDEWLIADELGYDIMVNEHHQTATCMSSTVIVGAVGAGAADQARAPPGARLSDRPPARSAALRRGARHHRRDLARPPRHGLHQGRAVRVRRRRTRTRSA